LGRSVRLHIATSWRGSVLHGHASLLLDDVVVLVVLVFLVGRGGDLSTA
jgi:hypothetical protein